MKQYTHIVIAVLTTLVIVIPPMGANAAKKDCKINLNKVDDTVVICSSFRDNRRTIINHQSANINQTNIMNANTGYNTFITGDDFKPKNIGGGSFRTGSIFMFFRSTSTVNTIHIVP